jgi:hypothetical protein
MSFDNIRVGKKYWLRNYGEKTEFQVQKSLGGNDFILKDLNSLEVYRLSDLVKYGKGKDFELDEILNEN